jgi:nitroimidazol reductase NimA-like FMN-containing flavoprotein (pyridoxamine 5'-phosphate oxidase superfamily)
VRELTREEVDELLVSNGVGLMSMVDGDVPYAIPMAFGYLGERMTFALQWGTGYEGRKERCVRSNPNVCFTVYEQDTEAPGTWRSAVVAGELRETDDAEREEAFSSLAANAEFSPDLGMWGVPFDEVELTLFSLDTENCTGREFSPVRPA